MSDLRKSWTREELQESAKTWAKAQGSTLGKYHENLGLLVDFVTDLFDGVNVEGARGE